MDIFKEIINNYIFNYNNYYNKKYSYECEYGELIFLKDFKKLNVCIVFGLYIKPIYRKKGLCKSILQYLIDNCLNKFKWLSIQSVISKVLYDYLIRFKYKNKKFTLKKDGFYLHI